MKCKECGSRLILTRQLIDYVREDDTVPWRMDWDDVFLTCSFCGYVTCNVRLHAGKVIVEED